MEGRDPGEKEGGATGVRLGNDSSLTGRGRPNEEAVPEGARLARLFGMQDLLVSS